MELAQKLLTLPVQGTWAFGEPMDRHTTMRVGGPADAVFFPASFEEIQCVTAFCRESGVPLTILGKGSNVVVLDGGLAGVVILIGDALAAIAREDDSVCAQAGAALGAVAEFACQQGLSGLEFAEGIPGSVGGGAVMNAGAYGGEMSQVVESIQAMDAAGRRLTLARDQLQYGYRHSRMMHEGMTVLAARFALKPDDPAAIRERMEDFKRRRREKQPLHLPSCGSFFKRPQGYFAGKLIQDAGLKGERVGGAQVSPLHAGFIVNTGGATAADVVALMRKVQSTVKARFGVELESEARILGRKKGEPACS